MPSSSFWALVLLVAAAHSYLAWHRLMAYLRYFQQEGYEHLRFVKWARLRSLGDPAVWLSLTALYLSHRFPLAATALFSAGSLLLVALQPDPRRSGKVPLRMTARATRVFYVAIGLASAIWLGMVAVRTYGAPDLREPFLASIVVFLLAPLELIAANVVLMPYERSVQNGFEAEARQRVKDLAPFIIGITGSYGKSSTKAMLAHILQFKGPTLAASGSINTLMGVTRHIREELLDGHRFMVVEMGAFKTGSIRRLCQLTPPSAGLITAVGDMHLERFGSTDEIIKAKGELAEALQPGALLVVNADSPGALAIARRATRCRVLLYGEHAADDLETRLEQVKFSRHGTSFVLRAKGLAYECFTPLLGRPIILNLAGAFTLAAAVGVDPEIIVAAIRTLRPVSNRLEVVEERGVTWIRDAYNSNQFGFRAALEVAAALPVSRRFLATPGVIELGADQFQVNRTLSKEAAAVCDRTLVVAETNKEAFVAGHRDAGREEALVTVSNRSEAFKWLRETVKDGDVVILENDLPDLYERSAGVFWRTEQKAS
jgi:UDP-N-acetylmuramoyl-tripeptide--D-alanyl-D-alanine ligase